MMILASMNTELAVPARHQAVFFFLAPFTKDLTSTSLLKRFQKMDPELGVMDHDAEL
jgi:hypothetical protein